MHLALYPYDPMQHGESGPTRTLEEAWQKFKNVMKGKRVLRIAAVSDVEKERPQTGFLLSESGDVTVGPGKWAPEGHYLGDWARRLNELFHPKIGATPLRGEKAIPGLWERLQGPVEGTREAHVRRIGWPDTTTPRWEAGSFPQRRGGEMNRPFTICASVVALVFCILAFSTDTASAAPVSQSFTLRAGWNAVFLEVDRVCPIRPELVFAGVPGLLSVWAWNPRTSPVQFIDNPGEMTPASPYMLAWFPGQPLISNLHAVHGERAYLIHRDAAAGDYAWVVNGEPTLPHIDWVPDSFNLVGFHAATAPAPDMETFFAASPALAGQEIYRLSNTLGVWEKVANPLFTPVNRGEAFWVFCRGAKFTGPLSVQLEQGTGLTFGTALTEARLVLRNASAAQAAVAVAVSAPASQLHYWFTDAAAGTAGWRDMAAQPPAPYAVPAGDAKELRLGVLRAGIPEGEQRAANVRIAGNGMEILVPVSVTGIGYEGLWVGDAVIRKVSRAEGWRHACPDRVGAFLPADRPQRGGGAGPPPPGGRPTLAGGHRDLCPGGKPGAPRRVHAGRAAGRPAGGPPHQQRRLRLWRGHSPGGALRAWPDPHGHGAGPRG